MMKTNDGFVRSTTLIVKRKCMFFNARCRKSAQPQLRHLHCILESWNVGRLAKLAKLAANSYIHDELAISLQTVQK